LLQRLGERLEHSVQLRGNGLANGFTEDGKQGICQHARIRLDGKLKRFFEQGLQSTAQFNIGMQSRAEADGIGEDAGDIFGAAGRIIKPLAHGFPGIAIRAEKDRTQFGERFTLGHISGRTFGRTFSYILGSHALIGASDPELICEPEGHFIEQAGQCGAVRL
jgi:hypothetical protein